MSAVVVRVDANIPCPPGFVQQGTATRRTKLCVKQSENPVSDAAAVAAVLPAPAPAPAYDPSVEDLEGLLSGMTLNQPAIVELTELMSVLGMSGKGRRKTKKTRKTRRRKL